MGHRGYGDVDEEEPEPVELEPVELDELDDADRVLEVDPLAVGMEITCR